MYGKIQQLTGVQYARRRRHKSCSVEGGFKLRKKPPPPKRKSWSPSEAHRRTVSEALKRSPLTGAGEANLNARDWSFVAPDGSMHQFRNLALFVRKHAALFEPDDVSPRRAGRGFTTRAQIYLGRLRPTSSATRLKEWKGWRWLAEVEAKPST